MSTTTQLAFLTSSSLVLYWYAVVSGIIFFIFIMIIRTIFRR